MAHTQNTKPKAKIQFPQPSGIIGFGEDRSTKVKPGEYRPKAASHLRPLRIGLLRRWSSVVVVRARVRTAGRRKHFAIRPGRAANHGGIHNLVVGSVRIYSGRS